ncbi:MAG: ATP-dependent DNA ligase [Verrucomicrobiales bacterium]|nr:ATP-dependent DNA ligase [Verrucomicrobiales bacterium]
MSPENSIAFEYREAVFLPSVNLWLDPHEACPFAFVSHAHADHFASHKRILCSRGTHELIKSRFGERDTEFAVLDFGETFEENGLRFTLFPAGHIAGSAQILIEDPATGDTLLYTGDFKTRPSLTSENIEIRKAKTLIMETTFGLPQFIFPPAEETIGRLTDFVQLTLDDGLIPIVQGYSLGKAQELIAALHERLPEAQFQVHSTVQEMNATVRSLGFSLPDCETFEPGKSAKGAILVVPPVVNKSTAIRNLKNSRSAVATGWAINSSAKFRFQVDEAFPLSDHAGYDELLDFVGKVDPQVVYTLHGYASEFATDLRNRGREAWSLTGQNQLELDLGLVNNPLQSKAGSSDSTSSGELAELTRICDQIRSVAGKNQKKEILSKYLQTLSKKKIELICLYLSGRCFPAASPDGKKRATGVGWAVIKRALIRAAGVSESEYRQISASQADGARTAFLLLEGKGENQPASIADLASFFESLSELQGPIAKEGLLVDWFQQQHHAEAALTVSILLGDLRIGLGEGLIEESIAEAFDSPPAEVRKAQMYTGHLGLTAILAMEGRLDQWELTPFNPLSSMLASPGQSTDEIFERFVKAQQPDIWIEDKYDGIRAQLHKFDDWAEWFSRDLRTLTAEFPELAEAAMSLPDDVVLDGEIIAFAEGRKLTFFDLQTRLGRQRNEGDLFFGEAVPVTFVVFDLLWQNGRILTETPLRARRDLLEKLQLPDSFRLAEVYLATDQEGIEANFKAACERGNEGIIVKDPDSDYLPGLRGKSWLKLKKAAETLDVVVVKAQQGHGRRSHVLSDYTFAVKEESTGLLKVIGKAYSGLTDEEIEELTDHFKANTVSVKGRVHTVEPDIVLEVAFDSIQSSKKHSSGLSLRFPRIKAIRRDKSVDDIDTLETARDRAGVSGTNQD